MKCKVIGINQNENTVTLEIDGETGDFKLVPPAKMEYIKGTGDAECTLNNEGNITFLKLGSSSGFKKPYSGNKFAGTGGGYKSGYGKPNGFRPSNQFNANPFYYESSVEVLTGITLAEFKSTYNNISKGSWITASQVFPKGDKFDAIIYLKIKKDGKRETPGEIGDDPDAF